MLTDKVKNILNTLKAQNLRITRSRMAVINVLVKHADTPLTSHEIFIKTQKKGHTECNQVSVYRSLLLLEKLDLVKKNIFQGDAARYLLTKPQTSEKRRHEHFFKCTRCNLIEAFEDCTLLKKEEELQKSGYSDLPTSLRNNRNLPKLFIKRPGSLLQLICNKAILANLKFSRSNHASKH